VRDIDTAAVDSLKVLDLNRPIREADYICSERVFRLLTQGRHDDQPGERAAKTSIPALRPQVSLQEGCRISDRLSANRCVKSHGIAGRGGEAGADGSRVERLRLALDEQG
jgi:hypothetical protein